MNSRSRIWTKLKKNFLLSLTQKRIAFDSCRVIERTKIGIGRNTTVAFRFTVPFIRDLWLSVLTWFVSNAVRDSFISLPWVLRVENICHHRIREMIDWVYYIIRVEYYIGKGCLPRIHSSQNFALTKDTYLTISTR